ncbi:MAG: acyl-ACP--UDP-N-acetylglucosamine O-acyltransferase [Lentimonas sp.]
MSIHSTALVSETAKVGAGSTIGPFALVEDGVIIGQSCTIEGHAILRKGTVLGDAVTVDSFAVVGGNPQAIGFDSSTQSGVVIGCNTIIREGCTIHRSTEVGVNTVIGNNCFLMAQSHVAHDCVLANDVILANNVMLAGHVTVGEKVFFGGGAGIHQNCRIGAYVMVAGNASVAADVPPYVMTAERNMAYGLNMVGLRRGGFDQAEIADLKKCYRAVYFGGGNLKKKAAEAASGDEFGTTATGSHFLNFFEAGKRGFVQSAATE